VARQLLQLVAIVLELPDENQLASMTNFSKKGEDFVRFLKYHAKTGDGEMYATAHADLCTFTLNFRQPVAALQVQDEEGEYKWVKPWENSIMVTIGNTLTALTNGWVKSGMHRIHAPPKEQMHLDRLATPFIARGDCDFIMDSIKNSPVLQKAEKEEVVGGVDQGLTLDEWQKKWFVDMKARLTAKAATSS
jgi:isopenicillin N synthase-like dioxygenase